MSHDRRDRRDRVDASSQWKKAASPRYANGRGRPLRIVETRGANPLIAPGATVHMRNFPRSADNPVRKVMWINDRGTVGLDPMPDFRTFARAFDLALDAPAPTQESK